MVQPNRASVMVCVLDSKASGPSSGPGEVDCEVFLDKGLYSDCASLHPGLQITAREKKNTPSHCMLQKLEGETPATWPLDSFI